MAKASRIVFNNKAFNQLRTTPEAEALLTDLAEQLARNCGEGYEMLPAQPGRKRAHRVVATVTAQAAADNAKRNTLLRNLGR